MKINISRKNIIRIIIISILLLIYAGIIFFANKDRPFYKQSDDSKTSYEVAKVLEIVKDSTKRDDNSDFLKKGTVQIRIKILSGKYKGEETTIDNHMSMMFNVDVKANDKISVRIDERNDGNHDVSVYNYYRVDTIALCLIFFAVILILIGGKKGLKALIGLVFTLISIVYILLPLALKGFSPVIVTLGIVLISTLVSFALLDGISNKTIVATIGTFAGILVGSLFAILASKLVHITTYQMDEAESLILAMSTTSLKVRNLLVCGILISCMGAVMDVAMSIASAVEELRSVNPDMSARQLYMSGMNIGKDAMGTMANTLILAFAGNSLNMLILIYSYGVSFQQLINTDFIAIEVIKAIAGSIGIIVAVPLVALIAANTNKIQEKVLKDKKTST